MPLTTAAAPRAPAQPRESSAAAEVPALRLAGVSKSYRGHLGLRPRTVLHDLSLEVEPGKIHGLLGPNGAGKTTSIRLLLGLLRPDRGAVEIFGRPAMDPESRRSLGFLPEQPYFYDYLTAREFLDLSARLAGVARPSRSAEVARLLEAVGMSGHADIPLRRCSKGMVQRVGMAQALAGDPELLVLDEPMSGLDPVGRREFRDLILDVRRRGKTVFFSSHILQDAEMICDRVSILDKGRLVAEGEISTLLGNRIKFWEVSISGFDASRLRASWERLPAPGPELLLRVREERELDALLRCATEAGARIRAVIPCRDTLEDLFLRKIGK